MFGKRVWAIASRAEQMLAGLFGGAFQLLAVHIQHHTTAFAQAAGDDHGVDVAAFSRMHHGAEGVVRRIDTEVVGADQQNVVACPE